MRPLTHSIPARRDAKGNSLPKRFFHARPGVCADPEAILEITGLAADDPKAARLAYPRLKARQAIQVATNAEEISQALEKRLRFTNQQLGEKAQQLEAELAPLREIADRLELAAVEACAAAGCQRSVAGEGMPVPIPCSEDLVAAEKSILIPKAANRMSSCFLKLAATVGCGTIFGISCGLLSGGVYLDELVSNPLPLILWSVLGTAIVSLIGSTLGQLAGHIGEAIEWRALRSENRALRPIWPLVLATVGLGAVFTAIESQIEKLGILRSLREGSSFESFAVSNTELLVVSLLLALPVVCWYLVEGYSQAVNDIRRTFIAGEIAKREREVYISDCYRTAAKACVEAANARTPVHVFEDEIKAVKSKIRDELTQIEREQIEDCEFDALVADWAAEDALTELIGLEPAKSAPRGTERGGFLVWLVNLFSRKDGTTA